SVVEGVRLAKRTAVGERSQLVAQAPHQLVLVFDIHRRIPALVVRQARDVETIALAGVRHFRYQVRARGGRQRLRGPLAGVAARIDLDLLRRRDHHLFRHVADALVHHHHHRNPIFLGQIKGFDGQIEAFLWRVGANGDDAVVPVRSPARLHHVRLRRQSGQSGGRAAALHVDENARRLGHGGVAYVLHHQGETGTGGDGECLNAPPDGALNRDGGGQFVFHLDKGAADGGDAGGEPLDDLRGGGNRVACGKSRTGSQRTFTAGVVAVEKMDARENAPRISSHVPPNGAERQPAS